ncbi:aminotransferase class I/II-fold pyridoxal phosphate-dependent enzyme, partial [Acinetobacter baumannii]
DDMYEHLVYDDFVFTTAAQVEPKLFDRTLTVNGVSKAYCMTGWRIGWLVVPPGLSAELAKLIEYNTSCVPDFVQQGAIVALTRGEPHVDALRPDLAAKRDRLAAALRRLPGVDLPVADGAMYAFFRL